MSNRKVVPGACALLLMALFLIWLWRPEHQVRAHQRSLLSAVEDRNWERVGRLMSDNYSDRWGHDKEFVTHEAREVFRQFLVVHVAGEVAGIVMDEGAGDVQTTLQIKGRGGPLAEYAMTRVNALHLPWTFRWEQQSWKPWDWELVRVDQPELEMTGP